MELGVGKPASLRSQRRTARRAKGRGAAASWRASVASISLGEVLEQTGVVAEQPGLAGQHRHQVAAGDLAQHGQHLVPDPVAAEAEIVVARVVDRHQALGRAQRRGLRSPQTEQGPHRRPPADVGLGPAGTRAPSRRRSGRRATVIAGRGRPGPAPRSMASNTVSA